MGKLVKKKIFLSYNKDKNIIKEYIKSIKEQVLIIMKMSRYNILMILINQTVEQGFAKHNV
jgi:hypothetical protein